MDLTIILLNFGLLCSYTCITGDIMPQAIQNIIPTHVSFLERSVVVPVVSTFLLFPLACLKNLDALRWSSYLAMVCVSVFCVVVSTLGILKLVHRDATFVWSQQTSDSPHSVNAVQMVSQDFTKSLAALSVFFNAYVNQMNIPIFYVDLQWQAQNSKFSSQRSKLVHAAIIGALICTGMFISEGLLGYIAFGECTAANVLKELPTDQSFYIAMKIVYCAILWCVFPIMVKGCCMSMLGTVMQTEDSKAPSDTSRYVCTFMITTRSAALCRLVQCSCLNAHSER